jgi:RNA polymerase sigma factor (sigma-70 family)
VEEISVVAWSAVDRTHAERLAAALVQGDAMALGPIYDAFGAGLYDYCHTLLRDREAAADALHDALLATPAHAGRLRAPGRLRTWLYALVRTECRRTKLAPDRPAERREATEARTAERDESQLAQLTGIRQLALSALAGLTEAQREALDLTIRHDLTTDELADVLGIPRRQAADLARQARRRLDTTLVAALAARDGREQCPIPAALADGWPLTAAACDRVVRHVEKCPACAGHQPAEISINRLFQVLPVAAAPDELRERVLTTATASECEADRLALAERAGPFDDAGWPQPQESAPQSAPQSAPSRRGGSAPVRMLAIGGAVVALLVAVVAIMLVTLGSVMRPPLAADGDDWPITPDSPASPTVSGAPVLPIVPSPPPTSPSSPKVTPTVAPSRSRPPTVRPTAQPKPTAPPSPTRPGRLRASGCFMPSGWRSCMIRVTAVGGPVTWSVRGTSRRELWAYGGGTLRAGQSAGVTVTHNGWCQGTGSGTITFSPGGTASVRWVC